MVQVCSSLLVSSISSSHSSSSSVAFVWFCRAKCGLGLAKPCVSFYLHKLRRLAPPRRETSLYCSDWVTKRMTGREGGKRNRYNLPKLEQWVGRRSRRGLDGTFTIEGFFYCFASLSLSALGSSLCCFGQDRSPHWFGCFCAPTTRNLFSIAMRCMA